WTWHPSATSSRRPSRVSVAASFQLAGEERQVGNLPPRSAKRCLQKHTRAGGKTLSPVFSLPLPDSDPSPPSALLPRRPDSNVRGPCTDLDGPVELLNALPDLLAMDRHVGRGLDPQADSVAPDLQHRQRDVLVGENNLLTALP